MVGVKIVRRRQEGSFDQADNGKNYGGRRGCERQTRAQRGGCRPRGHAYVLVHGGYARAADTWAQHASPATTHDRHCRLGLQDGARSEGRTDHRRQANGPRDGLLYLRQGAAVRGAAMREGAPVGRRVPRRDLSRVRCAAGLQSGGGLRQGSPGGPGRRPDRLVPAAPRRPSGRRRCESRRDVGRRNARLGLPLRGHGDGAGGPAEALHATRGSHARAAARSRSGQRARGSAAGRAVARRDGGVRRDPPAAFRLQRCAPPETGGCAAP